MTPYDRSVFGPFAAFASILLQIARVLLFLFLRFAVRRFRGCMRIYTQKQTWAKRQLKRIFLKSTHFFHVKNREEAAEERVVETVKNEGLEDNRYET